VQAFKIRKAQPEDIDLLIEHRRMMFTEMAQPNDVDLKIMEGAYRIWALDLMKRGLFHGYVVTTARGKPAASGCVWLREEQPRPGRAQSLFPYVLSVYTRPEFRRNGLASMVMEEAMDWARKEGYQRILLHASVTGRKVYRKLGWKRTWEMEYHFEPVKRSARSGRSPRAR
jgi:GNAT superfamily N-acetyltransferase